MDIISHNMFSFYLMGMATGVVISFLLVYFYRDAPLKRSLLSRPIGLLEIELRFYERSLKKSIDSYEKGTINLPTHKVHKINLLLKINSHKRAIKILNNACT